MSVLVDGEVRRGIAGVVQDQMAVLVHVESVCAAGGDSHAVDATRSGNALRPLDALRPRRASKANAAGIALRKSEVQVIGAVRSWLFWTLARPVGSASADTDISVIAARLRSAAAA